SEERRVGKECRSRWWPYHEKKELEVFVGNGPAHAQPPLMGSKVVISSFWLSMQAARSLRATWRPFTALARGDVDRSVSGRKLCSSCSSVVPAVFFSSRRRHTRFSRDWSSDVCSSDLISTNSVSGAVSLDLTSTASTLSSTTVSGDITVRLPEGVGLGVEAKAVSGRVVVD